MMNSNEWIIKALQKGLNFTTFDHKEVHKKWHHEILYLSLFRYSDDAKVSLYIFAL